MHEVSGHGRVTYMKVAGARFAFTLSATMPNIATLRDDETILQSRRFPAH